MCGMSSTGRWIAALPRHGARLAPDSLKDLPIYIYATELSFSNIPRQNNTQRTLLRFMEVRAIATEVPANLLLFRV